MNSRGPVSNRSAALMRGDELSPVYGRISKPKNGTKPSSPGFYRQQSGPRGGGPAGLCSAQPRIQSLQFERSGLWTLPAGDRNAPSNQLGWSQSAGPCSKGSPRAQETSWPRETEMAVSAEHDQERQGGEQPKECLHHALTAEASGAVTLLPTSEKNCVTPAGHLVSGRV